MLDERNTNGPVYVGVDMGGTRLKCGLVRDQTVLADPCEDVIEKQASNNGYLEAKIPAGGLVSLLLLSK
jgi:activator of 2-hydroxyglutaryl-CoA dehydratase